jgi:hypothetical protein
MNVSRGLFRAWIVFSVLWLSVMVALGYQSISQELTSTKYQYVVRLLPNADPNKTWKSSPYEVIESPSKSKSVIEFDTVGYQYLDQWKKLATEGKLTVVAFPDSSEVYILDALNEADKILIAAAFWDQRWARWWKVFFPWLAITLAGPLVLFCLGAALIWIARGFLK